MKKVITYGSFDLLHEGHVNILKGAKALGDYLIVGITTEQYDISRGKLNITETLVQRIDNVRNTGLADEIIVEDHEGQKISDIQTHGVDVFAIGTDWLGAFDYLRQYCEVVYLERTRDISSTSLRNKRNGIIRLGVVGSGSIVRRFIPESKSVSGIIVNGVYNPRRSSAGQFAKDFELGFYSDNYDEFLEKVDAVYVASPHETHYEYAKRAIMAERHVLCEKPMVLVESQARELFSLAKKYKVTLMEAVKTAYFQGFMNLIAIAKGGRIGEIRDVEAAFTRILPPGQGAREFTPGTGGSFTELGTYPLLPIIKLLGANYKALNFASFNDNNGLDTYTKAYFTYENAVATAKTGIGVKSEGQLLISGTQGYILVASPWWLTKSFEVCFENPGDNEHFSAQFTGYGLRYEIADFVRCVTDGRYVSHKFTPADSIAMAGVVERFLAERKENYKH